MSTCCIDYDAPAFYNERYQTARKEHRCCECGGVIKPKERYQLITGKWDWIETYKTCEKCADLRDSLSDVSCPTLGDLRECYVNYLDDIGAFKYDEENDKYVYPKNHLRIGL